MGVEYAGMRVAHGSGLFWVTSLPNLFSQPPQLSPAAQPTNSNTHQAKVLRATHTPILPPFPTHPQTSISTEQSLTISPVALAVVDRFLLLPPLFGLHTHTLARNGASS